MSSIIMTLIMAGLYLLAYHTYGKYLSKRIFNICDSCVTPAVSLEDGSDYVPTKKEILFGHHFTSIAGTGPIVGPAIGVIWGWGPALLWVLFGSIFMGAVHDFGTMFISVRNEGHSIGDVSARIISPVARNMFLIIIALVLLILIAVFCLVIAILFDMYPQSVIPIWSEIPIAIWLGYMVYNKQKAALPYSLIALGMLYGMIVVGAYFPLSMPEIGGVNPVVLWTIILLIYAFIASILPVQMLLQPRDYINGHELFVAMGLLFLGTMVGAPEIVAPAFVPHPIGAPPMLPFLFITIACGAISGFHSLVGTGTSSKQLSKESHMLNISYGGMLTEGMLAIMVIVATCAGLGMMNHGEAGTGAEIWHHHYASWGAASGLGVKVSAFVKGSANMLTSIGISPTIGMTIMGVFVASFAGTSLDTSTRLQRYIVSEIATSFKIRCLGNKYLATFLTVITGGLLACADGEGKGGLILWPLFGGANQLLASLGLLVITVYLVRKGKNFWLTFIPFLFMLWITTWALSVQLFQYLENQQWHLLIISSMVILMELWMIVEAFKIMTQYRIKKKKSLEMEEAL